MMDQDVVASAALAVKNVTKRYGSVAVLEEVTFSVAAGERHGLIGPNGAGKSTLFGIIAGTADLTSGSVHALGRDVSRLSDVARARLGVAKSFQHSSLFDHCTVRENVYLAIASREGVGRQWLRSAQSHAVLWAEADEQLERAGLIQRRDADAGTLSHGERRQLEIALALALRPKLLLLDEPTAGMSPLETASFVERIGSLPSDLTILIIEHDLEVVFELAQNITVLSAGRLVETGSAQQIKMSPQVRAAYLGDDEDEELFV